jgi:serine/threonine protein kinase
MSSVDEPKPVSKRHFSSNSSSGPKRGKYENPDSKPSGSQKGESPIENFMSLYIFLKMLGFGAFGVVNLMQHRISGKHYAVKVIEKTHSKEDDRVRTEISLGMMVESNYVCKVYGYHEDDKNFYMIMEYLQGIDLCDFIRKLPNFFVNNPKSFWIVIKSILQGLAYLHSQGIAHFDVKPENIVLLFDGEGNIIGAKLIDLGLSLLVDDTKRYFKGTCAYMAPEFFHPFWFRGFPTDIWSLGMTLYAMLMASLPISSKKKDPKNRQNEIYTRIQSLLRLTEGSYNPFSGMCEDPEIAKIRDFICSLLVVSPDQRPTAVMLLEVIKKITSQMSL